MAKKKIYYAIQQEMMVDDNLSDSQIQAKIESLSNGKEFIWSEDNNLFYDQDYFDISNQIED